MLRFAAKVPELGLDVRSVNMEGPHTVVGRVLDPALGEISVEARLVDRGQRPEAHRDRGELPEVGHEARMRVRAQAAAGLDFLPKMVELVLAESALEERTGVNAGRRVARRSAASRAPRA